MPNSCNTNRKYTCKCPKPAKQKFVEIRMYELYFLQCLKSSSHLFPSLSSFSFSVSFHWFKTSFSKICLKGKWVIVYFSCYLILASPSPLLLSLWRCVPSRTYNFSIAEGVEAQHISPWCHGSYFLHQLPVTEKF